MIFTRVHCDMIGRGTKTQTRRLRRGPYKVGGVYAVQPGRGKKAVGHIRIKRIWQEKLLYMTEDDVRAEGFEAWHNFITVFYALNNITKPLIAPVWAFEFEVVE